MKKILFYITPLLCFFLGGCASITGYHSAPTEVSEASKLITYDYDEFDKEGWLSTAKYLGPFGNGSDGVTYNYRAKYREGKLEFVQLYMTLMANDWYFINEISDTSNDSFNLIEIDREVMSGSVIHEDFAITLNIGQLKSFAKQDKRFKVSGKRGSGVFTVSKQVTSAFIKELETR